ncbi:hypothetical protein Dimus_005276 [Dionaea muscipula]
MVKVHSIGNGWLYKSVIATFAEYRTQDLMFESFMSGIRGLLSVRRMGSKKVLITFSSEAEMKMFIEDHPSGGSYWFDSVTPWSVKTDCNFGREVWLSCYGVPSTRLEFAEEQAVFICNSNFRCQCACHGKEIEQACSPRMNEEDDDVEEGGLTQLEGGGGSEGDRDSTSLWEEEMRGSRQFVVVDKDKIWEARALGHDPPPCRSVKIRGIEVGKLSDRKVALTLGSMEENVNDTVIRSDAVRKDLARVDCSPIVSVSGEPGITGSHCIQSAEIIDQRRLEIAGSSGNRQSSAAQVCHSGLGSLQPTIRDIKRPIKRGRPSK